MTSNHHLFLRRFKRFIRHHHFQQTRRSVPMNNKEAWRGASPRWAGLSLGSALGPATAYVLFRQEVSAGKVAALRIRRYLL